MTSGVEQLEAQRDLPLAARRGTPNGTAWAAALAGAVALGALVVAAFDWNGRPAALVVAAALLLGPGIVAGALARRTLVDTLTWTMPIGLVVVCLGSRVALWLDAYRPAPLTMAICLVVVVGAVLVVVREPLEPPRFDWRAALRTGPLGRGGPLLRGACAVTVVCWLVAVATTDDGDLRTFGLLGAITPTWFVAVGATGVALVVAWRASSSEDARPLVIAVGLVLLVLFATAPIVYEVPRFAWTYKHIGLADYFGRFHTDDRAAVDIYQAWPSFFSGTGLVAGTTSSDGLVAVARWWPLTMNIAAIFLLRRIYGALVADRRLVWAGIGVFLVGNWIGQDYFSPQSVGFLLALAMSAVVIVHLIPPRDALRRRLRLLVVPTNGWRPQWRYVAAALVFDATIVVTHQLSPYLVLVGLIAAVPLLGLRPMWFPLALIAFTAAYALLNYHIVTRQGVGSDFGSVVSNVESRSGRAGRSVRRVEEFDVYYRAAIGVTFAIGLGALLGIRSLRQAVGPRLAGLVMLAIGPAFVVLAEAYGQEGVLRVNLFCLPWLALGAGAWIAQEARAGVLRRAFAVVAVTGVLAAATIADFGRDLDFHVAATDVAMTEWYERNSPPSSVLVSSGVTALPSKSTAWYFKHSYLGLPEPVADDAGFDPQATLEVVAASVEAARNPDDWFFAFGPTIVDRSTFEGYISPDEIESLHDAVRADPRWTLVFTDGPSQLYRWQPQVAGTETEDG